MRISSGISSPTRTPITTTSAYISSWKSLGVGEGQKQQGRGKTANHSQQQFDPDEAVGESAIDVAGKRAADPHGKQVAADDRGELKNAVAEKIAGERARDELVDEPAGGDQQDRDEKQYPQGLVNSRRNDDADAERHCPEQDRQRGVVLLHDFLPEVVGSYLVDDEKCRGKDQRYRSPRR